MIQDNLYVGLSMVALLSVLATLGYVIQDNTYYCSSRGIVMECDRFSVSGSRCYPNLLDTKGYRDCSEGWKDPNDYLELLVKTSDNCFKNDCTDRTDWSDRDIKEERTGNSKQGYIVLAKPAGFEWGNLERDPSRFAIITIPVGDWNESWLEPEYNLTKIIYDVNDTCEDLCLAKAGKDCESSCMYATTDKEVISQRKYRFPLDTFLNETELTQLNDIEYNVKPNFEIKKEVIDIDSKIEYNDWNTKEPDLKLHGSSGTFYINTSGGDYTSLSNWEAGEDAYLTGTGPCIAIINEGFYDDTQVFIDGWTTTADDYIEIRTEEGSSARHNGTYLASAYFLNVSHGSVDGVIDIDEDYVRLIGLQVGSYCSGRSSPKAIYTGVTSGAGNTRIIIDKCIVFPSGEDSTTLNHYGIEIDGGTDVEISNTIVYGFRNYQIFADHIGDVYIWNTLVRGDYRTASGIDVDEGQVYINNTISFNNTGADIGGNVAYWHSSHMATDDDYSFDPNNRNGLTWEDEFIDWKNNEYHLLETSSLIDNGTNISANFIDDIDGDLRGDDWDIGPDEYVVDQAGEIPPKVSTAPVNISRSNVSVYWNITFNEPANMTGTYNVAPSCIGLGTFTNTTKATTLTENTTGLTNSTEYCWNITSFCDSSGNCNNTGYDFNFTTDDYILVTGDTCDCSSIQAGTIIDCTENCDIATCDAQNNVIVMDGNGIITISGDLYNYDQIIVINSCTLDTNLNDILD